MRYTWATVAVSLAVAVTTALSTGAAAAPSHEGPHHRGLLARDDFRHGTRQWRAELEQGGSVTAKDGVLDVDVPAGASVWFKRPFSGRYEIDFTATPVSAGGANDRVSDLNSFWNARDARSPEDLFATARSGALADYDHLTTYYAGLGANYNTTTRLRRYVGVAGSRPLIYDYTSPLLTANEPNRIRLVSDGRHIQYWDNGELVFDYTDQDAYTSGWFAFRTTWSHFHITDFRVWRLGGGHGA
ncbi:MULTISPECIES: DUF6250 domain-containing protein [Streptomyces]|uniref:DUF6250 domain-containing protein n=1 Tax=Streptomyces sviceus (strain ATCC 29083 / DSM 924 / JCM 4929 / NBRC 13980 / NCIMB 11184 / NRRL 5439 / UC 5370) TaxID=463191 RepID=B5I3M5_STRX2|nr:MULTISPECIES: DUF6250 domain-containing protein [Streptomyces]EDY59680.1 conserved hypothetical protein [Streptomyces sviceus ATCC 29083]MYT03300.1 Tat pathway signal sequence domain protein [Streptomyces sp. SID5470]